MEVSCKKYCWFLFETDECHAVKCCNNSTVVDAAMCIQLSVSSSFILYHVAVKLGVNVVMFRGGPTAPNPSYSTKADKKKSTENLGLFFLSKRGSLHKKLRGRAQLVKLIFLLHKFLTLLLITCVISLCYLSFI
jgi:hypothetical protein